MALPARYPLTATTTCYPRSCCWFSYRPCKRDNRMLPCPARISSHAAEHRVFCGLAAFHRTHATLTHCTYTAGGPARHILLRCRYYWAYCLPSPLRAAHHTALHSTWAVQQLHAPAARTLRACLTACHIRLQTALPCRAAPRDLSYLRHTRCNAGCIKRLIAQHTRHAGLNSSILPLLYAASPCPCAFTRRGPAPDAVPSRTHPSPVYLLQLQAGRGIAMALSSPPSLPGSRHIFLRAYYRIQNNAAFIWRLAAIQQAGSRTRPS